MVGSFLAPLAGAGRLVHFVGAHQPMQPRREATEHLVVEGLAGLPLGKEADGRQAAPLQLYEFVGHGAFDNSLPEHEDGFVVRAAAPDGVQHGGEAVVRLLSLVDGQFVVDDGFSPDVDRRGAAKSVL